MSQPTPYNRVTSFSNTFAASPTQVFPGASLDAELNNAKITLDQILANIQLIQKDDGTIANGVIGPNQLSSQISVGFTAPTVWQTGVKYGTSPVSTVFHGTGFYTCQVSHTSGTFATDLAAGDWLLVVDFVSLPLTNATQVAVTPAGTITQVTVQAALQQLDSLKQATATLASTSLIDATATGRSLMTATSAASALSLLTAGTGTWSARQTFNYTPVFDLNGGQFSVDSIMNTTNAVVVPAGKTFSYIRMSQADATTDTFTIGSGGIGNGVWVDIESLSGSDSNSNCYAGVLHVTNSGPGTTKAIHADAIGKGSSNGVLIAVAAEVQPISTTNSGSACVQLSLVADALTADSLVCGIAPISTKTDGTGQGCLFQHVIGTTIQPVPINTSFYQAWIATASAANARAFTTWNNAGSEIQYIKKTGEVVSSTGLIAGTEANGVTVTQGNVTRNATNGNLVVEAGSASGIMSLKASGHTNLELEAAGTVKFADAASFSNTGAVATVLGSAGPVGSHTAVQTWLTIVDNNGITRYIPCF